MSEPDEFARHLRQWRRRRGLSQARVAERVGVVQQTVAGWERGEGFARLEPDRLATVDEVYELEPGTAEETWRATTGRLLDASIPEVLAELRHLSARVEGLDAFVRTVAARTPNRTTRGRPRTGR